MGNSARRDIKEVNFFELLENSFYVIPFYQRGYSWDEQNIASLWDDIVAARDSVSDGSHFMSSMLVKPADSAHSNNTYYVVDGQQRITTLFVFIKAALDSLENHGHPLSNPPREGSFSTPLARLTKCLYGTEFGRLNEPDKLVPRLQLEGPSDDNALAALMEGGAKNLNVSHQQSRLISTYNFFCGKFNSLLRSSEDKFFRTVEAALYKLQVVCISILEHEAPQKIYESVNGLTKKLYAGELIKNYLLMSMPEQTESNRVYEKYWAEFDKLEWTATDKHKEKLTRNIYFWLTGQGVQGLRVTDEDVYRAFKRLVGLGGKSSSEAVRTAEKVSASLHRSITTLAALSEAKGSPSTRLEQSYHRLFSTKQTATCASAFSLLCEVTHQLETSYGVKLSSSQLDRLLLPFESFVIRKTLSPTSTYGAKTTEFLITVIRNVFIQRNNTGQSEVSTAPHPTVDGYLEARVRQFAMELAAGSDRTNRFERNESLFNRIVGNYEKQSSPLTFGATEHEFVRMLLIQIENHLSKNDFRPEGTSFAGTNQSLEHWLPQKSDPSRWPLLNEKNRSTYTNSIGNLSLLPQSVNSSLSNQSLPRKLEMVQSRIPHQNGGRTGVVTFDRILQDCQQPTGTVWNEQTIERRSRWIMDILLTQIFKEPEHFTRESRPSPKEKPLWAAPLSGRRMKAVSNQTTIRAFQQPDGTFVIDEAFGIPKEPSPALAPYYVSRREAFLRDAVLQPDGTYSWKGHLPSPNRTGMLAVILGTACPDIWTVE